MEVVRPISGTEHKFNKTVDDNQNNINNNHHNHHHHTTTFSQTSTTESTNSNFDFNSYTLSSLSYPSTSSSQSQLPHHQHQPSAYDQSHQDQQRLDQQNLMPNQTNSSKQDLNYPSNEQPNNNFTNNSQYCQPRSGPLNHSQLEYTSYNFQFPSNSYHQSGESFVQQHEQHQHLQHHLQQLQQQQQQFQPHSQQPLRSPLPPTQFSKLQTPNNIVPPSHFNSNFQYSSTYQENTYDQSPLYSSHLYHQQQQQQQQQQLQQQQWQQQQQQQQQQPQPQYQSSYFPQYASTESDQKSMSFNDPFAIKSQPQSGKFEEFSHDDVQILKSLLFNGEKVKWKYVSSKLANVTGRRATPTACSKKTRELFRLPSEKDSGDLGTSLPYVVHDSWKKI